MIILENDKLKAVVHPSGGELYSIVNKETGINYLWNGDPAFWPRHSPVLFPIVGGLLDDSYLYKGERYKLIKHGFARDMDFEIEHSSSERVTFMLKSSEETQKSYPFNFLLRIAYVLLANKIVVTYQVENPSDEMIYFSIGAHPAFNIPLVDGTSYEDYYLEFSEQENAERYTLDGNLISGKAPYFQAQTRLPLQHNLFYEDALIFKDLKSDIISIKSDKTPHGLHFNFEGFPYMGIWAAKDAPFVCIEPWYGIADSQQHNQNLEEKEGIISLAPREKWESSWSVECF